MNPIQTVSVPCTGMKFTVSEEGVEIARAHLYIMGNGLHAEPFGLMEDVFVAESHRGGGLDTDLVNHVIKAAREAGCYKLIATSRDERFRVHELYQKLGFVPYGREFRMDLLAV